MTRLGFSLVLCGIMGADKPAVMFQSKFSVMSLHVGEHFEIQDWK